MSALTYVIFIIVALLAAALGAVGAYFYYRARHREAVAELQSLDQDLAEREEELHRLQYQFRNTYPGTASSVQTGSPSDIQKLRDELEQKKNDYNILKQDFDLEIGILKQELEQLREEKTNVEHSRRHLARKDAELEERETVLREKEADVEERTNRLEVDLQESKEQLEADLQARKEQLESDFRTRKARLEADIAERDRQLRARRIAIEEEEEELQRALQVLKERQERLDQEIMELPTDKFTSRQEALLIKRLRQQIKLQREELEHLQRLYHKANEKLKAAESTTSLQADAETGSSDVAGSRETADTFPSFSTLSSYVDRASVPPQASRASYSTTEAGEHRGYDDLTFLPGLDSRLQEELYELGITSFDQIARWSSADVRRISERLEVDPKTIQDHWIINAQSHLFSRQKAD